MANKERAVEKLEEYLKSDTYLYTPLEGTQHRDSFAVKTVIPPPRGTAHILLFENVSFQTLFAGKSCRLKCFIVFPELLI